MAGSPSSSQSITSTTAGYPANGGRSGSAQPPGAERPIPADQARPPCMRRSYSVTRRQARAAFQRDMDIVMTGEPGQLLAQMLLVSRSALGAAELRAALRPSPMKALRPPRRRADRRGL